MAYALGADITEAAMIPFLGEGKRIAAYNAAAAVQPNMAMLVGVAILLGAFLGVLRSLPQMLGISEDGDDQDNGEKKP